MYRNLQTAVQAAEPGISPARGKDQRTEGGGLNTGCPWGNAVRAGGRPMRFPIPDIRHENTRTIGDGPPLADTFSPK
jgi:hypothetical protein